jgi:hypothetical protein
MQFHTNSSPVTQSTCHRLFSHEPDKGNQNNNKAVKSALISLEPAVAKPTEKSHLRWDF